MLKQILQRSLATFGYQVKTIRLPREKKFEIPDRAMYQPLFSPWFGQPEFSNLYSRAAARTLVPPASCYILWTLLRQALTIEGDIWECGVYKGGTASIFATVLREAGSKKKLYLFDSFQGMPDTDSTIDSHAKGDFVDTSASSVAAFVGADGSDDTCILREGFIPHTFLGLENAKIAFAHVDVVLYHATLDSAKFIWPRLTPGGFIVFDDYGYPSCPGARAAIDEFFADKSCIPLCLPTGQAIVFKGPTN